MKMYVWDCGTIYGWRLEMDPSQSSLPAVFAAIPVLFTIAESPLVSVLEILLESLLESLFECLLESLLERASHREE
jgi:hypothetical protein